MTENTKSLEKAKDIEDVHDVAFPRYNRIVKINGILTGLNMSESEHKEFREMEMMK